jgi:hypothetical protein
MQKGNYIGKVGLVIAYKKNIRPGQFGKMFRSSDL